MDATRELWSGGPTVSAIGLGTWALGGPAWADGEPRGWGRDYDRNAAAATIRAGFDAGITLFDTSDAYGAGNAERLLGETLADVRDEVTLVSKWGNKIEEASSSLTGTDASPAYVRKALHESLRRLQTDHLDIYLLHLSGLPADQAAALLGELQGLVSEGLIGAYGWSTDDLALAQSWVGQPGFRALEFEANVVRDAPDLVALCEKHDLAGLVRSPLGTGLLTGTYTAGKQIVDEGDFRLRSPDWLNYFRDGKPDERFARRLEAVTEVITAGGRTSAQGALAWVWARSPRLVPVPGARSVAQVQANAATLAQGPLTEDQMREIEQLLGPDIP